MCYSPEADLIAGLVIGAVAVDAIRHVDDRRIAPLAAVPLVLAAHQLIEAVAWWGLQGQVPAEFGRSAAATYLIIAFGVVPLLVPYAVFRAEPDARRRTAMLPFVVLGSVVSVVLLVAMAQNPFEVVIGGRYLAYSVVISSGGTVAALYCAAVSMPLLMSTQRRLVYFGMVNVPAFIILSLVLNAGLISLWCVWAAITSVVVTAHIREVSVDGGVPRKIPEIRRHGFQV